MTQSNTTQTRDARPAGPSGTDGMHEMGLQKMAPFLRKANIAVLSWTAAAGTPMSTPVWYRYKGGKFLLHSMHPTGKTRGIQRSDAVSLCIQDPAPPYRYVTVAGRAKLVFDGEASDRLQKWLARAYFGRVAGNYYLKNVASAFEGEHAVIEITPGKTVAVDGSEGINPVALAAMKAMRKIPGL